MLGLKMDMESFETTCSGLDSMVAAATIDLNHGLDWSELDLFGLDATHASVPVNATNVEEIYAEIHKSVDQAVSTINQQGRFTPESIKQQNRKVVDKLSGLENDILQRTHSIFDSSLPAVSSVERNPLITPPGMYLSLYSL